MLSCEVDKCRPLLWGLFAGRLLAGNAARRDARVSVMHGAARPAPAAMSLAGAGRGVH
jgi:hypothetical protein